MKSSILMVGAGPMAQEYAKVLTALQQPFIVVGRSEASCALFTKNTGIPAISGGLAVWKKSLHHLPAAALVAVSEDQLGSTTQQLLSYGIKKILVEKPGGLDAKDIRATATKATQTKSQVYVGYNRRFYASVQEAQRRIKQEGGVTSFHFEFTEWSHKIAPLKKNPGVKENWFLQNSSHVIGLAFFLGGMPKQLIGFQEGSLPWHPLASRYAGSGITTNGATFSYQADWESAGRWSVEIMTKKSRYILRPLEQLFVQQRGSVTIEEVSLQNSLDIQYKPGLYHQVEAFLKNPKKLLTIHEQAACLPWYTKIHKDA